MQPPTVRDSAARAPCLPAVAAESSAVADIASSGMPSPVSVEKVLSIRGGWLPQTTPLPEQDVKVLQAGPLGEITFVHVNMQKTWLLRVCAKGKPTPGALKASQAWAEVRGAFAKQGGAAVADAQSDGEEEGERDDPMSALLGSATPTDAKKQKTSTRAPCTGLPRGEAAEWCTATVHSLQMPARSRLKYPGDTAVRHVRVASFKRRTLWLDATDLPWLIESILDDLSLGGVPDIADGDKDEAAVADGGWETAVDPATPQAQRRELVSPVKQGNGVGFSVAWNFKGAWVATITRECANKGKVVEMEVKKLTKKKWQSAQSVKQYDYHWEAITQDQRKQAALDFIELQVPSLFD